MLENAFGARRFALAFILAAFAATPMPLLTQDSLPVHLRDRGTGVATSIFGTYIRGGDRLYYPFLEGYLDNNFEYKPSELGYGLDVDHRGKYRAAEALFFVGYGLTDNLAVEFEAAVISATLEKSPTDPSAMPQELKESGLGDVEGQIRWRWQEERGRRPEAFTYFETVFPLQRNRKLIGTQDWEFKLGQGFIRGFSWGTMTFRTGIEYSMEEKKFEFGEYAVEYLRRISPAFRVVTLIEGNQLDEVELIPEIQWHFSKNSFLKANIGIGITPNATDFAPEIGVMFVF